MAFLPYPVIDLYIRAFVSGSQPHSGHRYFIDLRPNTPGHLWLGFALSSKGTVAGADSRLQRAVSVAGNTSRFFQRSIKGSVSGRYPVIPLLGISVRKAIAFPSLLPLCRKIPRRVCMRQRVAALSNGANLAPHEISMLFAVLPETNCQGLFNQIHKNLQKRCQKHRMAPDTSFDRLHFSVQQVFAEIRIVWQLVDIWLPAPLDFGQFQRIGCFQCMIVACHI